VTFAYVIRHTVVRHSVVHIVYRSIVHIVRHSVARIVHHSVVHIVHRSNHSLTHYYKKTFVPEMFFISSGYFTFVWVIRMWRRQGEVSEHWDRWKGWSEWTAHRWEISWVLSLYHAGIRLVMDEGDKKCVYKCLRYVCTRQNGR